MTNEDGKDDNEGSTLSNAQNEPAQPVRRREEDIVGEKNREEVIEVVGAVHPSPIAQVDIVNKERDRKRFSDTDIPTPSVHRGIETPPTQIRNPASYMHMNDATIDSALNCKRREGSGWTGMAEEEREGQLNEDNEKGLVHASLSACILTSSTTTHLLHASGIYPLTRLSHASYTPHASLSACILTSTTTCARDASR